MELFGYSIMYLAEHEKDKVFISELFDVIVIIKIGMYLYQKK